MPVFAQSTPVAAPTSSLGWSDDLSDNGKLNVATTVAPISSIVRNVGGDRINLHGIIPDGTNSHTFEPAPSDAQILSAADIIIVNGLDLEDPTLDLANPRKRTAPRSSRSATRRSRRINGRSTFPSRRAMAIPIRISG